LNKREKIEENINEYKKIIMKGSENEFEEDIKKILISQNECIKELNPNIQNDKELLIYIIEANKEIELLIKEKKKIIVEQVNGLNATKENKKNYDLYK
jgi:hypothetical protein